MKFIGSVCKRLKAHGGEREFLAGAGESERGHGWQREGGEVDHGIFNKAAISDLLHKALECVHFLTQQYRDE